MLDPPSSTLIQAVVGIQEAHASYNARQTKKTPTKADAYSPCIHSAVMKMRLAFEERLRKIAKAAPEPKKSERKRERSRG
jgi:hypothetical protein